MKTWRGKFYQLCLRFVSKPRNGDSTLFFPFLTPLHTYEGSKQRTRVVANTLLLHSRNPFDPSNNLTRNHLCSCTPTKPYSHRGQEETKWKSRNMHQINSRILRTGNGSRIQSTSSSTLVAQTSMHPTWINSPQMDTVLS